MPKNHKRQIGKRGTAQFGDARCGCVCVCVSLLEEMGVGLGHFVDFHFLIIMSARVADGQEVWDQHTILNVLSSSLIC